MREGPSGRALRFCFCAVSAAPILVAVVGASCASCARSESSTPSPEQAAEARSGAGEGRANAGGPRVDECGSYRVDVELPQRGCTADEDCAYTSHRPGSCVDPLCDSHYRAGSIAWVKTVNAMHERICGGVEWRYCERVKCVRRDPVGAACVDGACVVRFE